MLDRSRGQARVAVVIWSGYNTLFRAKAGACLCYNAVSGRLMQVDSASYGLLTEFERGTQLASSDIPEAMLDVMREGKFVVDESETESYLLTRRRARNTLVYDGSIIDLTICPTLSCNFDCSYCFEDTQSRSQVMSREVMDGILRFISSFDKAKGISVTWYGGEPTLAFSVVRELTPRIGALGLDFNGSTLVTNGYLLDEEKIRLLSALSIDVLQITIDGPREVHDQRRVLRGGGGTFDRIVENIAAVVNSGYRGSCSVRVNLDRSNVGTYQAVRSELLARFPGGAVDVYAGPVEATRDDGFESEDVLSEEEWRDFSLEMYGIEGQGCAAEVLPQTGLMNVCSANSVVGFVVGPTGDLYKCWEDVGRAGMVVGSVLRVPALTDSYLEAAYSVGTDPFDDPECRVCKALPICGGGCVNRRMMRKYHGEEKAEYCSQYRRHLEAYLVKYFERYSMKEVCRDLLNVSSRKSSWSGFRIINP